MQAWYIAVQGNDHDMALKLRKFHTKAAKTCMQVRIRRTVAGSQRTRVRTAQTARTVERADRTTVRTSPTLELSGSSKPTSARTVQRGGHLAAARTPLGHVHDLATST